jgi:hypothetical protein
MKYIAAQPQTAYYAWQVETMIKSFLDNNVSEEDIIILLADEGSNSFDEVFKKYPKVDFNSYDNNSESSYAPALKPYLMWKYFSSSKAIDGEQYFYCDADVILTKVLPKFAKGKCYLSDTVSYIGYEYIISKGEEVLDLMCEICNIDKEIVKKNQIESGGAQYIFDGTDGDFWKEVYENSISIFDCLAKYNVENSHIYEGTYPIQAWTSEMWATLWQFWKAGINTMVVPHLDFAWATDMYSKLNKVSILHNAGVGDQDGLFKKFQFTTKYPPKNLEIKKDYCSHYYYEQVKKSI